MRPYYISSLPNEVLNLVFDIYFDSLMNEYQVRTVNGGIIFKAETIKLAKHGIKIFHNADITGSKLTAQ